MHRTLVRVANAGLVVFGLALVIVLGTGGTRLELGPFSIGLRETAAPLTFLGLFAALRLATASRASGLEARLVTFLARQGLPPRDAPATWPSSVRAGALIGMGLGVAAAVADLARLLLSAGTPGVAAPDVPALGAVLAGLGLAAGAVAGSLAGLVAYGVPALRGTRLGRYEAGRWTLVQLLALAPALAWLAPEPLPEEHLPPVLLATALALALSLALAFLAVPAAVLRARRGRWGLAVTGLAILAIVLGGVVVAALGPGGLYGPARDAAYPNVLLVSISGLRPRYIGAYQAPGHFTPVLNALAFRGATFDEVVSPSVDLAPAAASALTGLYPSAHGLRAPGDRLRPGIEGLPEVLAGHGFRTGAFVSSRALAGRATNIGALFERYDDPTTLRDWLARTALGRPVVGRLAPPPPMRSAEATVGGFREWLTSLPRGPWFAWVELAGPLQPQPEPPPPERVALAGQRLPDVTRRVDPPPAWAPPGTGARPVRDWLYGYALAVRAADAQLDVLQQVVTTRGDWHRTLLVVVSEIGAPLGEDGPWFERPTTLGENLVLVPWIASGYGVRPGIAIEGPCSLVDVAPTVLGLIGLGGAREAEGEDLSRYLTAGGNATRDPHSGPVFTELVPANGSPGYDAWRAIRLGRWKLLRGPGGNERLFVTEDGDEREIALPRGHEERQRQRLSDMLSLRLAQEARHP